MSKALVNRLAAISAQSVSIKARMIVLRQASAELIRRGEGLAVRLASALYARL